MVMAALAAITTVGVMNAFASKPDRGGGKGGHDFVLSGRVEGLWPGARVPIEVTAENPYRFDIVIDSLHVGVSAVSASCPASVLHVSSLVGEVRIAARSQGTIELEVSLDSEAPNECQSATWALTYTATAQRA
jgi:hypothetical protein